MAKFLHTNLSKNKGPFEKLLEWTSDERIWNPKDRLWYVSYSIFFLVLIGLAALLEYYIVIIAILAFVFLWFTQAAVPPEKLTTQITSLGIKTYGKLFKWRNIKFYWFSIKEDRFLLNLDIVDEEFTSGDRVHRLSLIIFEKDMEKIFNNLVEYIEYGERNEVNYNIISRALHGKYLDITEFLPEDIANQDDYLEVNGKKLPDYENEEVNE